MNVTVEQLTELVRVSVCLKTRELELAVAQAVTLLNSQNSRVGSQLSSSCDFGMNSAVLPEASDVFGMNPKPGGFVYVERP